METQEDGLGIPLCQGHAGTRADVLRLPPQGAFLACLERGRRAARHVGVCPGWLKHYLNDSIALDGVGATCL